MWNVLLAQGMERELQLLIACDSGSHERWPLRQR